MRRSLDLRFDPRTDDVLARLTSVSVLLLAVVMVAGCVSRRPVDRAAAQTPTETPLARAIGAALAAPQPAGLAGEAVDVTALRNVYAARRNEPLWLDASGTTDRRAEEIVAVLADAASEGLDPRDYHVDAIRLRLAAPSLDDAVPLELLLSDGMIRYAVHQTGGVRPPAARSPEASIARDDPAAAAVAREVAESPDAGTRLRAFAAAPEPYRRLRDALAFHRRIAADGGWPVVPEAALRPGVTNGAVPVLRRRLAASGDLEDDAGAARHDADGGATRGYADVDASHHYDDTLEIAVRRFQRRHGIPPDGVVGKGTVAALNVPVGRRIDTIVANMERWRWLGAELGTRHVRVNIPDYTLDLVDDGATVLTMPVVVGKTDWQTPVISSEIRRVVFNPSWSVPPSIARKEILPKANADAGYLGRQGLVARRVAVASDPNDPTPRAELRLRQPPGPRNPLGRVKFELPNPFGVYLHDTTSRRGFVRAQRALSHGCVRLEDALGLADALLPGADGWSAERRQRILATWTTQSIALAQPVPVHVLYETAWIDELGALHFRPDVYHRDDDLRRQMVDAGRAPLETRSRQRRVTEPIAALP